MTGAEEAGLKAVRTLALQRIAALSKGCETAQDEELALLAYLVLQQLSQSAAPPGITLRQLETLQEQWPHVIEESDWTVATRAESGQPSFTVVGSSGVPQVLASAVGIYTNAKVTFYSGACRGVRSTIQSVSYANGAATITLNDNLPRPVDVGDRLTVTRAVSSAVAQAVSIAQVAGAAVSPADWTALFSSPNTTLTTNEQVTVNPGPTRLDSGLAARRTLIIQNNNAAGGAVLYVGGSSAVTTAAGFAIYPQGSVAMNLGPALAVYGVSTASTDVRVLELA